MLRIFILSIFLFSIERAEADQSCENRCTRLKQRSLSRIGYDDERLVTLFERQRPRESVRDVCWRLYDNLDCMKKCSKSEKHAIFAKFVRNKCRFVLEDMEPTLKCISKHHSFLQMRCSSFLNEASRLRAESDLSTTPRHETCRYLHLTTICLENHVNTFCPNGRNVFRRLNFRDYFLSFILPTDDDLFDDEDLDSCQIYDFVKDAEKREREDAERKQEEERRRRIDDDEDYEEELTTIVNEMEQEDVETSTSPSQKLATSTAFSTLGVEPKTTMTTTTTTGNQKTQEFTSLIDDLIDSAEAENGVDGARSADSHVDSSDDSQSPGGKPRHQGSGNDSKDASDQRDGHQESIDHQEESKDQSDPADVNNHQDYHKDSMDSQEGHQVHGGHEDGPNDSSDHQDHQNHQEGLLDPNDHHGNPKDPEDHQNHRGHQNDHSDALDGQEGHQDHPEDVHDYSDHPQHYDDDDDDYHYPEPTENTTHPTISVVSIETRVAESTSPSESEEELVEVTTPDEPLHLTPPQSSEDATVETTTTEKRKVFSEDSMENTPPNFYYSSNRYDSTTSRSNYVADNLDLQDSEEPLEIDTSTLFGIESSETTVIPTVTSTSATKRVRPWLQGGVIVKPILNFDQMDVDHDEARERENRRLAAAANRTSPSMTSSRSEDVGEEEEDVDLLSESDADTPPSTNETLVVIGLIVLVVCLMLLIVLLLLAYFCSTRSDAYNVHKDDEAAPAV